IHRYDQPNALAAFSLAAICIAQPIDLYSGKGRRQRKQLDGLQAIMRWSAEQRIADRGGDEYAVILALQKFSRFTLQLRGDPEFLVPNCVPASGQTLCPCNGLRGLAERHAIGISEIEAHGTAKVLRAATS